ncbi:lysylphosphatidylglycerol synthase transmembrane domain-containing protein [Marinobacter sp. CHS3-4]|uniref:lysylphosphatidylglycerol synthase transmembrane domain-containing protein n=1 Tax=Marinobacter sp. CHS3-4 TaxID=3045174 RepID=UPI0024B57E17|nr:lysylphosphatidylglycerol synthase transmembrane domain-containing protein [Marinobacter sp. CHS3-4]MDI9245605.1 lysylphosphatidylglycerol synthase transmembrane domain-containing protein [Marinobacter sp. CHS3-4]
MTDKRGSKPGWLLVVRWVLTVAIIGVLMWSLDLSNLAAELSRFSWLALLAALVVSVFQVVISAWRWRFTAGRLGLHLPFRAAIREYYLAMFLNQCLPGGVVGDVNRAWRHGRGSGVGKKSFHAVMIERLSGQIVMALVAILACIWLVIRFPGISFQVERLLSSATGYGLITIAALLLALYLGGRAWQSMRNYFYELGSDIYQGLIHRSALLVQLFSSLIVMATYLSVFLLLAASAGTGSGVVGAVTLLALCSLLLLAMVIPLTIAGWGVREGAAALLWPLVGLPAEQGVALSVGYGLTILLSSLPGVLFVFSRPGRD